MMSALHWRARVHDCRGHTLHEMIPTSVWQRVGRPVRHGATNFDQIDVFTQRGYTMKLISNERMKTENLTWGELIAPNEHPKFWHHEIVDSTGQVHIGVVYENGAVETACAKWDSIDTFERFRGRPILNQYS